MLPRFLTALSLLLAPPCLADPSWPPADDSAPMPAPALTRQISQTAIRFGIDPDLLHALVRVESGFDPRARSAKGAIGLMQLIPATGSRFGALSLEDPEQNLQAGSRYLVWLLRRFDGDLPLALAAYNAGEGAVARYGNRIPPYPETAQYVARVLRHYRRASPRPSRQSNRVREVLILQGDERSSKEAW